MKLFNQFFDFFLPRFCISCEKKLSSEVYFVCSGCIDSIKNADAGRITHEFNRKFLNDKLINDFTSPFVFEKEKTLQHIIHALKYNGNFRLGIFLGRLAAEKAKHKISEWDADIIVPVPIHRLKKAERGYNQSFYISKGIGSVLQIQIVKNAVVRKKFTETQTAFASEERKENVKDAFAIKNKNVVRGKKIILVDDVITTGATISECAKVLIENGAEKVFAFSVAVAD
ncbi:MAG: ComF family protein [Ignavibacteriales bacterium]|nr:ComF family protein [Ignavibacteriales bacterium]